MGKILLVDDDDRLRDSFYNILGMEGHTVRTAASGETALRLAEEETPDAVIMDVRMPGMDGLTALRLLHGRDPRLPVIIMTAYSTTESAIEATKLGAFDYILKPFEIPDMLELVTKALEAGRLMRGRVVFSPEEETDAEAIIGKSRAMHRIYKAIGRIAPTDALVLLRGESGTDKELVARAVYHHSTRNNRPFLAVNCVAIPESLLESELFGFERGAFTGAANRRIGKIEQAAGGTVFLDEIGDMPISLQAKLLRLLQERQIERLGGGGPVPVDVRIIAATNRDLEAAVSEGRFREDLYYRLNVVTLHLPPLRERLEDVPHLVRHFMNRIARELGRPAATPTDEALERLAAHSWPGNVRELQNLLRKMLILGRGTAVRAEDVERALSGAGADGEPSTSVVGGDLREQVRRALREQAGTDVFDTLMDNMGALIIREALDLCAGNRSQAARLLGLSRPTLLARIDKYHL